MKERPLGIFNDAIGKTANVLMKEVGGHAHRAMQHQSPRVPVGSMAMRQQQQSGVCPTTAIQQRSTSDPL
jgi:hypothetical protein